MSRGDHFKCSFCEDDGTLILWMPSGITCRYNKESGFAGDDLTFPYDFKIDGILNLGDVKSIKLCIWAATLSAFGRWGQEAEHMLHKKDKAILKFLNEITKMNGIPEIQFTFEDLNILTDVEGEELGSTYDIILDVKSGDVCYASVGVNGEGIDILTCKHGKNVVKHFDIPAEYFSGREKLEQYNLMIWLGLRMSGIYLANDVRRNKYLYGLSDCKGNRIISTWGDLFTITI